MPTRHYSQFDIWLYYIISPLACNDSHMLTNYYQYGLSAPVCWNGRWSFARLAFLCDADVSLFLRCHSTDGVFHRIQHKTVLVPLHGFFCPLQDAIALLRLS